MADVDIVDVNLFDPVPVLAQGEPVKGGLDGPANKQAIVLANRTFHLKEELGKTNKSVADLDADKVGADAKGTAAQLMHDHLGEENPHPQYMTVLGANLPGGAVLLDVNGKIPEQFMEIFRSSYIVAPTEAERLALPVSPDLTIVAQADNNTMYYLNGGMDPSVAGNWIKGQSATVAGVVKVFGRTGDVTAQNGDYNADQITETPDRVFLTPAEKSTFALKQEKLISGSNVKTVNGEDLLGSGDLKLTPAGIGAEEKGEAQRIMDAHNADPDPHSQYIKLSGANLPNGPVLLDPNGKIPEQFMEIFKSSYIVVPDEPARLALPVSLDLSIVAQASNDTIYYLNGGDDPSDPTKWIEGQSATVSGVGKVFGRTGDVVAKTGDYNADQITETPDRVFLTPAEKQSLALKQDQLKSGVNLRTIHGFTLLGSTDIKLDSNDVGADAKGTASSIMGTHVLDADPHPQYMSDAKGDARYLKLLGANLPNGAVLLDANGKIPEYLLDIIRTSYLVVPDEPGRLAVDASANLVIVAQADIDTLFYLNGGLDPSVSANWVKGQSATVSGVSRVFGRTGVITAQVGDYNADQISETPTRVFLSPAEKTAFAAKQEKLVSGTNIKSINGKSMLGSGDNTISADDVGAAAKSHTHIPSEITGLDKKISDVVSGTLVPGVGVSISTDPNTGKILISAPGGGGSGGLGFVAEDRFGSTAGQTHSILLGGISDFNLTAFALKKETGASGQLGPTTDFTPAGAANYAAMDGFLFNNTLRPYRGETKTLAAKEGLFATSIFTDGIVSVLPVTNESIIPVMSANNLPAGYVASANSQVNATFAPWYAFDGKANVGTNGYDCWAGYNAGMSVSNPIWLRIDMPNAYVLSGYSITNRSNNENPPKSWTFQGSNDDGATWDTLDTQTNVPLFTTGEVRNFNFVASKAYKSYRVAVTAVGYTDRNWVGIAELKLFPLGGKFLLRQDAKYYTVANSLLTEVTAPVDGDYIEANGISQIPGLKFNHGKMEMVSKSPYTYTYSYTPNPIIVVPTKLYATSRWESVNKMTMTTTETGTGTVRAAITLDMVDYYVFKSGAWVNIGPLTAVGTDATKLVAQGMSKAEIAAITAAQWKLLFTKPSVTSFGYAFAFNTPLVADDVVVNGIIADYNAVGAWKVQTPAEVEIRWYPDGVGFKTNTAGDYKLVYQVPS